jgi:branched-chain amino acid transport system ATP-binding protein
MRKGCTVCWLVEQNANLAFDLVESVYFLEVGTITIEGKAKELVNNDKARKTSLGG